MIGVKRQKTFGLQINDLFSVFQLYLNNKRLQGAYILAKFVIQGNELKALWYLAKLLLRAFHCLLTVESYRD